MIKTATALAEPAGAPMQRLAEQLSSLTPPQVAAELAAARPSAAVEAALKRGAQVAALAAKRAQRARNRTLTTSIVDSFISACAFVPYALAALAMRLAIARVFFINGQAMIDGPRIPISLPDFISSYSGLNFAFNYSLVMPFGVKAATFDMFLTHYAAVPMPAVVAAYLASYAAFFLPILLALGLATRFAAVGLLVMTVMINIVMPEALWTSHAYWAAILLVLISQGGGRISLDHIIRLLARR